MLRQLLQNTDAGYRKKLKQKETQVGNGPKEIRVAALNNNYKLKIKYVNQKLIQ